MKIGVLALQGAFSLHVQAIKKSSYNNSFDVEVVEVRKPSDLKDIDGIVLPGGESTVISKLLRSSLLYEPLRNLVLQGLPVLATCAGLIILANDLSVLKCEVNRNAYGTQIDSFEKEIFYIPDGKRYMVSFIRAPKIASSGEGVEILAELDGEVVGVRQGNIAALTCHPEVQETLIFHDFFLSAAQKRVASLLEKEHITELEENR